MKRSKILSGEELVAQGATKQDASLPEIGLKDVVPNGSWLEQKQIQSAVEARKHLIEVERIQKCGVLSHAIWNEELGFAEVTKQTGSYWQYLGQHIGKKLYLRPEEALFLMEVNCLQLTYNEVTVSLQQAYSLLLRGAVNLLQYKVYASLSRIGYKVFKHNSDSQSKKEVAEPEHTERNKEDADSESNIDDISDSESNVKANSNSEKINKSESSPGPAIQSKGEVDESEHFEENKINADSESNIEDDNGDSGSNVTTKSNSEKNYEAVTESTQEVNVKQEGIESDNSVNSITEQSQAYQVTPCKELKLQKLMQRDLKFTNRREMNKCFESIPEMCSKAVVTIAAPQEEHLPRNIFLNNTTYVLNLLNVVNRSAAETESNTRLHDEQNDESVLRLRNAFSHNFNGPPRFHQPGFNPFGFQRPCNFFNFGRPRLFFPNSFSRNQFFMTNTQYNTIYNRPSMTSRYSFPNLDVMQLNQLQKIKQLANRLKLLVSAGNVQQGNESALRSLILTYNIRYKTSIHLNESLELIERPMVYDTIALDDDDEPRQKKSKPNDDVKYDENIKRIKQLASTLKKMSEKGESYSRLRRAFSNLVKTFNKTYNANVYMNENYQIIDRIHLDLVSSDSDCEEVTVVTSKLLKNPFSIIKRRTLDSGHNKPDAPSSEDLNITCLPGTNTTDLTEKFPEVWIPKDSDFGQPEVKRLDQQYQRFMDSRKEEYIFDFINEYPVDYRNWRDVKISFWDNVGENSEDIQSESKIENDYLKNCLIKPGDCIDMGSVFNKLRIIPTCTDLVDDSDLKLKIDFDVYNRDVQNFRKSKKPKPHFRVICISESSSVPSGSTLGWQPPDSAPTVLAIVGVASISYLQMRQVNLHIPTDVI